MGTSSSHALAVRRTSQKQMTDYEKFADFVPRHLRTGLPVSIFDIDNTQKSCKDTFTDRRCMHTLAADIASGKAVLPPIRISRKFGHKRFRSADNRRLFLYKAMQLDIHSVPYEVIRWTEEFNYKSTLHSEQGRDGEGPQLIQRCSCNDPSFESLSRRLHWCGQQVYGQVHTDPAFERPVVRRLHSLAYQVLVLLLCGYGRSDGDVRQTAAPAADGILIRCTGSVVKREEY